VLDEQERQVALVVQAAHERGDLLALADAHPGDGLVEQHQLGLHRERARDLDALADAEREDADGVAGMVGKPCEREGLQRRGSMQALLATGRAEPHAAAQRPRPHQMVAPDQHVLERRQVPEETEILEGAGEADAREAPSAQAEQVGALEAHAARGRLIHAREDVEERGLARPVGTDHGEQLAARDVEAHVRERGDVPEAQRQVAHLEHRCGARGHAAGTASVPR
jgi:hypothetical protein